jgi:hypothetical protein
MPFSRLQTAECRVADKFDANIVHRYCILQAQQSCRKLPERMLPKYPESPLHIMRQRNGPSRSEFVFCSVIEVLYTMESNLKDM